MLALEITKSRSNFWLAIYDNGGSVNIAATDLTKDLMSSKYPSLCNRSPKGWRLSKKGDFYNLWLPCDCFDDKEIEELINWAQRVNFHIWLKLNKNTEDYFLGDELDFCVASDWYYEMDSQTYTKIGNAENLMKYHEDSLREEVKKEQKKILKKALNDCIECFPFSLEDYVVTTIPAIEEKQTKIAWRSAQYVSLKYGLDFIPIGLLEDKPEIKHLPVEDKIKVWREIFSNPENLILEKSFSDKNILIVDDMYQSGASIWCLAEYLKSEFGVKKVVAVTLVKSARDDENK